MKISRRNFSKFLKFQIFIENSLKISKNRKSENFRKIEKSRFSLKIFENRKIENFEFSKILKIFSEKFSKSIFSATTKSFLKNPDAFWSYDHGASFYIDSTTFPWPKIRYTAIISVAKKTQDFELLKNKTIFTTNL